MSRRLDSQPHELVDRGKPISFTYAGTTYSALEGDTVASALAANGVRMVARSFKYHRPRGLRGFGHSTDAMVQIGNRVSESIWLTQVVDGMVIEPAQTASMAGNDDLSLIQQLDITEPIDYRYKTFIHPRSEWNAREQLMREGAGLGNVDRAATYEHSFSKRYLHADVVVVGGGVAGISAAISAAKNGATVLLIEENRFLGGHLACSGENRGKLAELIAELNALENVCVLTDTLASGWFEDHWLFAVSGAWLYKIRAKTTILATGAEDQPYLFDNNDLPGVILGSAVQRLLHGYGVAAGSSVLVATANDDGWQLAHDLLQAGVTVAGVVEARSAVENDLAQSVTAANVPIFWGHGVASAIGGGAVAGAQLTALDSEEYASIECDVIALCTAWSPRYDLAYLAGCRFAYDEGFGEFRPASYPDSVFLAGRVTGTHRLADEISEGEIAGEEAAAYLGLCDRPMRSFTRNEVRRSAPYFRLSADPDAKRFLDLDKDVTDQDVAYSVAAGYNSVELLKRMTKISTGPSQGKWSSIPTIHLLAELNGMTVEQTGKTTSRAPVRPIKMGNLAGMHMEPVRVTPIHQWHLEQGAKMMTAGVWLRPERYGAVADEVRTVRQRVGIIDVSTLGKIKLTGTGVPALLDRLYTNTFSTLRVGRVRYGVMCNAEGVIMDDGVTARVGENEWYMSTTTGGAETIYEWIQWWVQSGWGEDVHVTSVSEGRAAFNVAGPRTREVLAKLVDDPSQLANANFPYMRVRDMNVAGAACRLMRIGFTGELSYEVHVPASQALAVWEAIMAAGAEFDIAPFGIEAQRVLRLEKAHIIVGQDTDPLTDPLMANMAWIAKLNKSDFLGKRQIVRSAERGVTQKLVSFKMEEHAIVPEEGLQIVREVAVSEQHPIGLEILGWVTSCKFSPTLGQVIGLCWLPTEIAEQVGTRFTIRREGELIGAQVWDGAFYDIDGGLLRG